MLSTSAADREKALNAVRAAAFADRTARRLRADFHRQTLNAIRDKYEGPLRNYMCGPSGGDLEENEVTVGSAVAAILESIYAGKNEYEARVTYLRNAADLVYGIHTDDLKQNGLVVPGAEEYVNSLRLECSNLNRGVEDLSSYLCVNCSPVGGQWFHKNVLIYRPGLEHRYLKEVVDVPAEWLPVFSRRKRLEGCISDLVFDYLYEEEESEPDYDD